MAAISREGFYKLEGLLTLAKNNIRELKSIEKAAAEITGEAEDDDGYFGSTTDSIYDGSDATQLLKILEIEVLDV